MTEEEAKHEAYEKHMTETRQHIILPRSAPPAPIPPEPAPEAAPDAGKKKNRRK